MRARPTAATWRRLQGSLALVCVALAPSPALAGGARASFGVSAVVTRSCRVDAAAPGGPDVACARGILPPRVGQARAGVAIAPSVERDRGPAPRQSIGPAPGGDGAVVVTIDF